MDVPKNFRFGNASGGGQRNEMRESGLHQLYILANSITCTKASGDRIRSGHSLPGQGKGESLLANSLLVSTASQPPTRLGNSMTAQQKFTDFTMEECTLIRKVALSPFCLPLLLHSLCDTIFGHEMVKLGLLLGILGGSDFLESKRNLTVPSDAAKAEESSNEDDIHQTILRHLEGVNSTSADEIYNHQSVKVRENIHVLIVGDPGLGKVSHSYRIYCIHIVLIVSCCFLFTKESNASSRSCCCT